MVNPGKIEVRLGRMLQKFDPRMFADYNGKMEKIINMHKEDISKYPYIQIERDEIVTGATNTSFVIDFDSPVYVTMSNPISTFRRLVARGSSSYRWQVSLVPVYFASINNMAMLKLYQDKAAGLFDQTGQFFDEKRCIRLAHAKGPEEHNPVKYSSMNIIEQLRAKDKDSSSQLSEIFQKYFEFGYWNPPGRGFTPGTYFHDDANKWKALFKITKSIYIIEKIGKSRMVRILDSDIGVTDIEVWAVDPRTLEIQPRKISAQIHSPIKDKISGNANIINGIMTEVKLEGKSKPIQFMADAFTYQPSSKNMTKLAMGILSGFTKDSRIEIQAFEGSVEALLESWQTYVKTDDEGKEKFAETIEDMFPVIISDGSYVYFVHALVWGFMERWRMLGQSPLSQREILLNLVHLLYTYSTVPFASRTRVNTSNEMKALKEIIHRDERNKLHSAIIRLSQEIEFFRMMKQCLSDEYALD